MKKTSSIIIVLFSIILFQKNVEAGGLFFNINATGIPANLNITLCLNGKGPISCQKYNVSALSLSILTNLPSHIYPIAGIKINTPGYRLANPGGDCRPIENGFCLFSVSNTAPANINFIGPKPVDYIIVGVGTAGSVLAKKLSDDKKTSVIGLQNGPNLNQDPLIFLSKNAIITVLSGLIGPPLYADSETIPQPSANNRNLRWIYALPLGGASSVNAGAWCRGTNEVYSQWEAIAGPNWSVNRILNTYKELENYNGQTPNPAARGYHGPLPVFQDPHPSKVSKKFTKAIMNATGVSFVRDYNNPNTPIGASSQLQYTQMGKNGSLRSSSAITFLNNNVMSPNGNGINGRKLQILFNSSAIKVIWKGTRAIGVQYTQNGQIYKLYARKGVILSAGIKSSAILMRSGVGPAQLLNSLNIPVVYNNPNVGSGLADQPHVVLIYTSNPDDTPSARSVSLGKIINALSTTDLGRALIQYIGKNVDVHNGLFAQIAWLPAPGGDPSIRALRFATINPIPGITVALFDLVQPASRGSIILNSKNPSIEPTMNLGQFSNPADLNLYLNGFQTYITAINTQLELMDPTYQMVYPDPDILNDVPRLTDFIRQEVGSNMHFQSHCRMAPLNQGGVVDSHGRVYGVKELIVADDSIVPVNMDGSPMATAYLIADNIANLLLGR